MVPDRVAICGIGNRQRGDDAIGPLVIEKLRKEFEEHNHILLLDCEERPESVFQEIEAFGPEHLILIDAVDFKKPPGYISLVDLDSVRKTTLSTHKLPISLFVHYLQRKMNFRLLFIGVQPKSISFGKRLSRECRTAIPEIIKAIKNMLFSSEELYVPEQETSELLSVPKTKK